MRIRLTITLWLLMFLSEPCVFAQSFRMTLYTHRNSLPPFPVNEVLQDSSGFVWLATEKGLLRFDGRRFMTVDAGKFQHFFQPLPYSVLAHGPNKIFDLQGMQTPDTSMRDFLRHHELRIDRVIDIAIHAGATFVLSAEGLARISGNEFVYCTLPGHNGNFKNSLLINEQDRLRLISPRGIYEWVESRKSFVFIRFQIELEKPRKIIREDSSTLLVLDQQRIVRINTSKRVELVETKGLPTGFQYSCLEKYKHYLLAGSRTDGLWLGKPLGKGYVFTLVMDGNEPHRTMELPFKNIHAISVSADDNLWVTHENGLALLQELAFERLRYVPMASYETAVAMPNGTIYLESDQGVFECYRTPDGEIEGKKSSVGANEIVATITGHGNRLWIATLNYELMYYEGNRQVKFANVGYRGHSVYQMVPDSKDNVWVLQAPGPKPIIGIMKITKDLKIVDYGVDKGFETRMLTIRESHDGKLFAAGIGENHYLYLYDEVSDSFRNISAPMHFDYGLNFEVHDLFVSKTGVIWLASTAGLLRYFNGTVTKIDIDELYEREAVAVTMSPDGAVWFGTDRSGIVRLDGDAYTMFNTHAGLATNTINYRSMRTDSDGTIWCGSREGLYISRAGNHPWRKTRIPVIISINDVPFNEVGKPSFAYESTLRFDFLALAYPAETMEYSYRVLNYGNDRWTTLSRKDSLVINKLKQGNYTLQLRARQPGGYQWSEPLNYAFNIEAVWYARNYMIFAYACVIVLLVIFGTKAYNKRLLREKEILEHKVQERTRTIRLKNEEITERMEELKQLTDEIATQRDNIEFQNVQLEKAKEGLEQKVHLRTLELSQANDELVDQNIQLEQFTFMTAHNLRAPIARLIGLTNIFNNTDLHDPFNKEVINRIKQSVSDLDEVVHDISTILQVKKGINGTFSLINLRMMLQKVMRSFEDEIGYKNIRVITTSNSDAVILGIEAYAFSVFYNVISNSIKYSNRKGPAEIHILAVERESAVQVKISDNGIGFESKAQGEKIFKPFSRFHTGGEGKGLGLYMIKIQMESMHGDVEIHSQVNVGTTVLLTFQKG